MSDFMDEASVEDTVETENESSRNFASPILVALVALLALGALLIPMLMPTTTNLPDEIMDEEIVSIETPDPTISESPEMTASPTEESTATELALDPMTLITQGLTAYKSKLQADGGVEATLMTADSQNVQLFLLPNGDYRALTDVATAPEWLFINSQMYARLGQKELTEQQAGLAAIGKPEAQWTNAAVGADKQSRILNAGNMTNAVSELVPLMQNLTVKEGPNGNKIVEGTVDPATASANVAEIYNLGSAGSTPATVAFTIDASDILVGYVVTPANAGQPVSMRVTKFSPIIIETPPIEQVITLEDLSQAANPSTTVAPAPPTDPSLTGETPAPPTGQTPATQPNTGSTPTAP